MADNTILNLGSGGDTVRDIDKGGGVKTQVVALDIGGAGAESLVTSTNPHPISVNAVNFIYSTNNSSTTQLAAGATFTGVIETALSQSAISLLMTSDQPMTLTVNQYVDAAGTYVLPPVVFNLAAGQQFSRSFALNGNYIRITAKNTGAAATTTFNLNTAYGVIDNADGQGNMPTIINGSGDFAGVSLLESVVSGDLAFHVNPINTERRDANGAQVPSDAPTIQTLVASTVGQQFMIDTQGYQTIALSMRTMAASVSGCNVMDGTFGAISCFPTVIGAPVTTAAANTNYIIPCLTRYIKLTVTTLGQASYTLRNIPLPALYATNASVNLAQINAAAVSATTAQLGVGLVNVNSAAHSVTNPVFASPTPLATTNSATIGQLIATSATATATIVKASAGRLLAMNFVQASTQAAFIHLQNQTTATTTTASVQTYYIPGTVGVYPVFLPDYGLFFSTGITFTYSNLVTSGDATALGVAPSFVVNYLFI